jgi:hypothetical protein
MCPAATGALGMRLEGFELACPERFDFYQPAAQLNERFRAQTKDAQPRVVLDGHCLDEAGPM